MPHKHRREKVKDSSVFELPPTSRATPLSVRKPKEADTSVTTRRKLKKRSRNDGAEDDTPKAFTRLMQFKATGKRPNGLDDGRRQTNSLGKKRKRGADNPETIDRKEDIAPVQMPKAPAIQPGERLSDFAARVDAALPVAGLIGKPLTKGGRKDPAGVVKGAQTKLEKRMQKMYASWREDDKKLREQREEELEEREMEMGPGELIGGALPATRRKKGNKKGKGKKRGQPDGTAALDDDDDPWAQIKAARNEGPRGLHDVAQAPPEFTAVPRQKFKVSQGARVDVADIPRTAGSLRKREELGETRKSVVEGYRRMMAEKRAESRNV